VESKFKFCTHAKHSHNKTDKTIYKKPPAFKVHLLEQEIDADWLKIKEAITKAAEESIGYKKQKNWKWLQMWNDKIQWAIKKKIATII
jgi:hypothetical protein